MTAPGVEATVTFNQVYEALNRVLCAYQMTPGRPLLENAATLLGDMSLAVMEADPLWRPKEPATP